MRESETERKYSLVLIVDDDLTMRLLERESLEQAGFVVEEAADGIQALAAFRRLNPDIVLFDVMMPEMDGFTLCKEIRKTEGGQLTPLLMVTGLDDLESINRAYEMGATEFIAKPINWTLLGHHVRYMLRASSAFADLKNSEEALREERDRAKQYLDIVGVLVMVLDAAGTIILVNRKGCEILGVKEGEMLGKNWFDTFLPQGRRGKAKEDFLRLTGGDIKLLKYYEIPVVTKGGEDRILSVHTSLMRNQTGDIAGILFSGEDITERKKMENELVKVEKLESIGILAGGIAHDFNNILTAILGNINLIRMSADPNDKMYKRLMEAEKATLRATDLTQQLLTFSRGGAPVKKTTSIAVIIKESSSFVLRGSNVKCELRIADEVWPTEADAGQMSQVIQNLVINASQAMPEGGVIRIHLDNLTLRAGAGVPLPEGKYIKIVVEDQGTGISEEHLQKIFDPYFTTKRKGNGLGLAIVYSIMKSHGGYITAESSVGIGTIFTLYLPASEKHITEEKPAGEDPISGKGRILIMDDEEMVRNVTGEMLNDIGYEIAYANDGLEMIDVFMKARESARPFDAVILDLTVPGGMGGKEAIKKLRKIDPHVIAIASSGYSVDPVMSNYKSYGFTAVLAKPDRYSELSNILHMIQGEMEQ